MPDTTWTLTLPNDDGSQTTHTGLDRDDFRRALHALVHGEPVELPAEHVPDERMPVAA